MNLPAPISAPTLIVAFAIAAVMFAAGWAVNGWRLEATILNNQLSHAEAEVRDANAAIKRIDEASKQVAGAAEQYNAVSTQTTTTLNSLRKEVRQYVKARPLPTDCKPDTFRVRKLSESVDAANQAISRR